MWIEKREMECHSGGMNMKRILKNTVLITMLFALFCTLLTACSGSSQPEPQQQEKLIKIPDVERLDVNTAKTLLAGKGLIPKVEEEYNNDYEYEMVIRTSPSIGSEVEEDTPVILYVCKGPAYYELHDAVGRMYDIDGIEPFHWSENYDGSETKGFYTPWVEEGYLNIPMFLKCVSDYELEFYSDFATASINDTFDKTVPIKVLYDSKTVDNSGETTSFTVKIPLNDLGVQKPTNIYIEFDFLVNGNRETFISGFDLSW